MRKLYLLYLSLLGSLSKLLRCRFPCNSKTFGLLDIILRQKFMFTLEIRTLFYANSSHPTVIMMAVIAFFYLSSVSSLRIAKSAVFTCVTYFHLCQVHLLSSVCWLFCCFEFPNRRERPVII